jgi:type VI secretion system secreted protein VgrG
MEISTPLDPHLLFHGMHAREEMSRLSEYQVSMLSLRPDLDLNAMLGKKVTVKLALPDDGVREFNGYVTRIAQQGTYGRYHRYQAVVRPWLWFLTRTSDCRIFQEMTVPEIVETVFADHPTADYKLELTGSYRPWTYCVQYRETDFNFVSRLLEEEGIYYYFKHPEGQNQLILTDSYSGHEHSPHCTELPVISPDRLVRPDTEHIGSWEFSREVQPGAFAHKDYDLERPTVDLLARRTAKRPHECSDYEVYDYPGHYVKKPDGEQYAAVRVDEFASRHEILEGTSNGRSVAVGHLLDVVGHPREEQNREYLITTASHDLEFSDYEAMPDRGGAAYRCSFTAISSQQQFRPRRITPKPFVQGPQTAVVVGPAGEEIYSEKFAQIKVQFHWDRYGRRDENSSCWIRVSQPWAGKGWGSVVIPRIDQEVIVEFIEGDPDQPIVTGCVYNGDNAPPYPQPASGVVSGLKSKTHKGKGFNEMSMDDTTGKEKITIHGQYDMNTTVEHDQTNTVNNDFTETIKKNATISITEGNLSHDVVAGTATYHVKGAVDEKYDATQKTTVQNALDIKSTAGPISMKADAQHIELKAATYIQLECGASKIKLDVAGNISVEGVNVTIKGAASVTTKGGMVHSEAVSQHQTKGAIVISEGSATNTVKGGMVMLNP